MTSIILTTTMPAFAIASGHQETSRAAAQILRQGGNAYDAILAAMMMSFVAEPLLSSPGGGGFMLAAQNNEKPQAFDFFPATPLCKPSKENSSTTDFYPIHGDFGDRHQEFHIGKNAAAAPTAVAGIYAIHEKLATLPLAQLAQPAIQAAQHGITVNPQQAFVAQILKPIIEDNELSEAFFGGMNTGAVWKNLPLSRFIDTLSKRDHDWFYAGEIAETICQNSLLTAADFEAVQVTVTDALQLNINGHNIYTTPEPSSGGKLIIEQLKAAQKDQKSQAELRRLHAMQQVADKHLPAEVSRGTSHISVVDGDGNLASMTLSNGEGNGVVLAEHGFMLNNFLGEEDLNPGGFFAWKKGDPLRSMMAPSLVINEQYRMALGTGGSNRIKTTLFQIIDRITQGQDLKSAINAPRFHYEKGHLDIEHGFKAKQVENLTTRCTKHLLFEKPSLYFGGVNAVQSGEKTLGYADFRRHGCGLTGF